MKNNKSKKINSKENNQEMNVLVSMPNEVEIILVQANELKHYELFQWLAILLFPIAASFWTAYFTTNRDVELLWSAVVFTIVSLLFIGLAYRYRKKVFKSGVQKISTLDQFQNNTNNK